MSTSKDFLIRAAIGAVFLCFFTRRLALNRLVPTLAWYTTILFLLQFSPWILWYWLIHPKYFSPLRHIPGPKGGSFFMGYFFNNIREPLGEPIRRWAEEVEHGGVIRYLDVFNSERIVPVSPAAIADVLVHKNYDFEKPALLRKDAARILGSGLFLSEGDEHKRQRKALVPAFAFRHVKDLYPIFWDKSKALVRQVAVQAASTSIETGPIGIEAHGWASRATLDIIGVAGMGQDFNALTDPTNKLNQTYRSIFKPTRRGKFVFILSVILPAWAIRKLPFKRNDDINNASNFIRSTCFALIESKKRVMEKGQSGIDILSVALSSGGFSDEDLVNQMMTFLAAGHETTASALTWAIYLLCKNPAIQTRLREEIRANLPNPLAADAPSITAADIDRLPYLAAVCQEVLRLYPPVVLTIREAVVDTSILSTPIPKGTSVLLSPWAVNRSTALWGPDALAFNPDRWLQDPSGGAESNFGFLTFLHGPRSCIGLSFARAELACLVAAWAGALETQLVDPLAEVEVGGGMVIKPKHGLWVKVKVVD